MSDVHEYNRYPPPELLVGTTQLFDARTNHCFVATTTSSTTARYLNHQTGADRGAQLAR